MNFRSLDKEPEMAMIILLRKFLIVGGLQQNIYEWHGECLFWLVRQSAESSQKQDGDHYSCQTLLKEPDVQK